MTESIYTHVQRLLQYGIKKKLITEWDLDLTRNAILDVLGLRDWDVIEMGEEEEPSLFSILNSILDWAEAQGKLEADSITYRDLLDTKIMGCLVPRASEVIRTFNDAYEQRGPEAATQYFYEFSQDVHYIRTDRIAKNQHWLGPTEYGDMEITINLSKPEKDPIAIAAERNMIQRSTYPECLLCKENVGYAGRVNHPARQNHRIIPVELADELWYFQYSPYVYYNEHCIVFSEEHKPMKISKKTFERLLGFVEKFPHYFIGSNADLPIVGGSILSHDHFQGGNHEFPMAKAPVEKEFSFREYPDVKAGIVRWPMSVIRLSGNNPNDLVELGAYILACWTTYSDESVDILSHTEGIPHNTITPIARRRGTSFELDLVLRNNRTNDEHPLGIFHPHQEVHHIKKENIGLIEVMGLAVLPGRLKEELRILGECLISDDPVQEIETYPEVMKHLHWALGIKQSHPQLNPANVQQILQQEVGNIFSKVLEHAGVFKRDLAGNQAFVRFLHSIVQ
ncbi:UDP-glucose--hexose-1-phosphate uridylyltransferase [Ammoniphilus sp. YIM 78166]|uniref:UDP-glucose--hexose-1-phosphate uridylyltransferase n=1 Tax=Ammoniphilus sp. YIM 78166 TaxID=1644106 RepID=UPI0035117FC7